MTVASAEQYGAVLAGGRITLSGEQRAEAIWQDVVAMAQKVGWCCLEGRAGGRRRTYEQCMAAWGCTGPTTVRQQPGYALRCMFLMSGELALRQLPAAYFCGMHFAGRRSAQVGGSVPASTRGDLLEEVTNLVESPTTVMGSFAADFLALPRWGAQPWIPPPFGSWATDPTTHSASTGSKASQPHT